MDAYEAIKIVMPRIQSLDPENASKIVCYILMKDRGEKEMIRLAFAPEALFTSYINQVKAGLGLLVPPDGSSSSSSSKPTVMIPNNGFHFTNPSNFPRPISYADILNGSGNTSAPSSTGLHLYGGGDELLSSQDQLAFLDDAMRDPIVSPSGRSDSLVFPYGEDMNGLPSPHPYPFHRRSFSVNDAAFLSNLEEGGGGWRPCMYFARGFCKNGSSCKFIHSDAGDTMEMGSPSTAATSVLDDLLRMKALQHQQKLALMASGGHLPFHDTKSANFLALYHRNDFSSMPLRAGESSSARQIYLTFPADSTFKEEDVFGYFGKFGPVRDVRIPYQQKRMFGFVTFFYPETVKLVLAKGNPHFVCDSRVLVKPYKEKGKVADKKQQQSLDRGEYSTCLSPSGTDSSELVDLPIGPRMLMNTQEMHQRKLEQELELRQMMELQGKRIMNLQLMDMENQNYNSQFISGPSTNIPISSPLMQSRFLMNQKSIVSPNATYSNIMQEVDDDHPDSSKSPTAIADDENFLERSECVLNSNLEHALPDALFTTPTKSRQEEEDLLYRNDIAKTTMSACNSTDEHA